MWVQRQERFLASAADAITVVNPVIREHWEKAMHRKATEVILNCPPYVDVHLNSGARNQLGIEGPLYLFSGALAPHRGIEECIRALAYVDGTLVLLSEGDREAYQVLADQIGVGDRVRFADFVPHTDVPQFISSADVVLLPYQGHVGLNHQMCSPSKLFHYIMAGVPIVASDFPFLRQVIVNGGLGYCCDTSSPQAIAEAIRMCLAKPDGLKGNLQAAKKVYCWENEEKKLLDIYRGLA